MKTLMLAVLLASNVSFGATLNDAQITQIVITVDKGEADLAKLASKTTKNNEVKEFAKHMVTDHTEGQKKANDLAFKNTLMLAESEKSAMMKNENNALKFKLNKLKGADFDKAYISSQVDAHQKVLSSLTHELIPAAQDKELKTMLKMKRSTVEGHLKHAKEIQESL